MANAGPVGHRGDGAGPLIEIAPELRPADTSRWSARIGRATAAVAFIAFAIVALATMQTGLHGDPRTVKWLGRRRIFAVFITAFIAGTGLPLLMVIYDSVLFAVVAVLCVRDDNDRPAVVAVLAQRLPVTRGRSRPRITAARLLVTASAVLMSAVLAPSAVFSLLRISGHNAPAYDRCQYPTVRVYDPYGDLQRAGKPGPFYR